MSTDSGLPNIHPTAEIHPTAVIHPMATIGANVKVGPFCYVGQDCSIGEGTILRSQVVIDKWTTIGKFNQIHSSAALGGDPQDTKYSDEPTSLVIGDYNIIREFVTIHRATGEGCSTTIGNHNMIMSYCHIGHNCTVGNHINISNQAGLSGHVVVEDNVVFGGMVGVHQFTRIGKLSMIGGMSKVVQDVPPFMLGDGRPLEILDLNTIGLRRNQIDSATRAGLRQAYKLLYRSKLNMSQAIDAIEEVIEPSPERDYLLDYMKGIRNGFGGRALDPRRQK